MWLESYDGSPNVAPLDAQEIKARHNADNKLMDRTATSSSDSDKLSNRLGRSALGKASRLCEQIQVQYLNCQADITLYCSWDST